MPIVTSFSFDPGKGKIEKSTCNFVFFALHFVQFFLDPSSPENCNFSATLYAAELHSTLKENCNKSRQAEIGTRFKRLEN